MTGSPGTDVWGQSGTGANADATGAVRVCSRARGRDALPRPLAKTGPGTPPTTSITARHHQQSWPPGTVAPKHGQRLVTEVVSAPGHHQGSMGEISRRGSGCRVPPQHATPVRATVPRPRHLRPISLARSCGGKESGAWCVSLKAGFCAGVVQSLRVRARRPAPSVVIRRPSSVDPFPSMAHTAGMWW